LIHEQLGVITTERERIDSDWIASLL
jgi:hypothetical protein